MLFQIYVSLPDNQNAIVDVTAPTMGKTPLSFGHSDCSWLKLKGYTVRLCWSLIKEIDRE